MFQINRGIKAQIAGHKFALFRAGEITMSPDLTCDKERFFGDWDHLELDEHLKDGAQFRKRRFGWFYYDSANANFSAMEDHRYFQPSNINGYAGGVSRKFALISEASRANPFLHELVKFNFRQLPISSERLGHTWAVDVHQIRITASCNESGAPTPEGMHRDGDDFVYTHLIRRQNISGGQSKVSDDDGKMLTRVVLSEPLDTMILWDPYVLHGVTPIMPQQKQTQAFRDVLLIGFHYQPDLIGAGEG